MKIFLVPVHDFYAFRKEFVEIFQKFLDKNKGEKDNILVSKFFKLEYDKTNVNCLKKPCNNMLTFNISIMDLFRHFTESIYLASSIIKDEKSFEDAGSEYVALERSIAKLGKARSLEGLVRYLLTDVMDEEGLKSIDSAWSSFLTFFEVAELNETLEFIKKTAADIPKKNILNSILFYTALGVGIIDLALLAVYFMVRKQ